MAKLKPRLTPDDCAMARHGLQKILEAKELWERCAAKDPEVRALVDSAVEAYHILSHYLCEFGDGDPNEYK